MVLSTEDQIQNYIKEPEGEREERPGKVRWARKVEPSDSHWDGGQGFTPQIPSTHSAQEGTNPPTRNHGRQLSATVTVGS